MKKVAILLPVLALFLTYSPLTAEPPDQESGCPAHQAAQKGFTILQELHQVMAPAWHEAYPEKNYEALAEACKLFDAMMPKLNKLSHTFKTTERQGKFNNYRGKFMTLIGVSKAALEHNDHESVYKIFPNIHESFEVMASSLLPLQFPEYKSLRTVVDLMVDTHLKNKDYEAITSSLEALKIKNEMLQKVALPEDLKSVEKNATADIAGIGEMCVELEAACGSTSTQKIEECLKKLKILCDKFEQDYI